MSNLLLASVVALGALAYSKSAKGEVRFMLPEKAAPYKRAIEVAESVYNLPPGLLGRVLMQESSFDPDVISGKSKSKTGDLGIAQFSPITVRELGVDPLNPYDSIDRAAYYLAKMYAQFGTWSDALAGYNWGPNNVINYDVPDSVMRNYVRPILADVGL